MICFSPNNRREKNKSAGQIDRCPKTNVNCAKWKNEEQSFNLIDKEFKTAQSSLNHESLNKILSEEEYLKTLNNEARTNQQNESKEEARDVLKSKCNNQSGGSRKSSNIIMTYSNKSIPKELKNQDNSNSPKTPNPNNSNSFDNLNDSKKSTESSDPILEQIKNKDKVSVLSNYSTAESLFGELIKEEHILLSTLDHKILDSIRKSYNLVDRKNSRYNFAITPTPISQPSSSDCCSLIFSYLNKTDSDNIKEAVHMEGTKKTDKDKSYRLFDQTYKVDLSTSKIVTNN